MTEYKEAGVDITAGNNFAKIIKSLAVKTYDSSVLGGIGGFAALYELPSGYKEPVLVSSTDGIGSKVKLAAEFDMEYNVGIDLVAMCVNDVICCGAKPLFFLDYYSTGKLTNTLCTEEDFIRGIVEGCQQAEISLVGGETAEMPGLYQNNEYDAAGFCVGIVEKEKIISPKLQWVIPGDVVIGLVSSGPHANGFSLIRKILDQEFKNRADIIDTVIDPVTQLTLLQALMEPTKIYVNDIQKLLKLNLPVKGIAHITGGGLIENIPRILPNNVQVKLYLSSWIHPEIFTWLTMHGAAAPEIYQVFNCGIGMVIIVPHYACDSVLNILNTSAIIAYKIGSVESRKEDRQVILNTNS
ncbi:MAG: phosphoribosylformylglycinamidine cyclo-ligase [Nitrosopumilaceae archaeon]